MKDFVIRLFVWLKVEWNKAWSVDEWTKLEDWRCAQANDSEMFDREPELDALAAASSLLRTNPELGFSSLSSLARRGSVMAMLLVGIAYEGGIGVTANLLLAEHWYRLAFEGGARKAQLHLGRLYERRTEYAKCEDVYRVGADDGWAPAMYHLAMIMLRRPRTLSRLEDARSLLEQAAAQGDLGAQIHLARFLASGRFGWRRIPDGLRFGFDAGKKFGARVQTVTAIDSSNSERPNAPSTDGGNGLSSANDWYLAPQRR